MPAKAPRKTPGLDAPAVFHFDRLFLNDEDEDAVTTDNHTPKEAKDMKWIEVLPSALFVLSLGTPMRDAGSSHGCRA
jgi:hypothetical protein